MNNQITTEKHEVYECKICKAHYLSEEGIKSHLNYRHDLEMWLINISVLFERVPFGATEFDV